MKKKVFSAFAFAVLVFGVAFFFASQSPVGQISPTGQASPVPSPAINNRSPVTLIAVGDIMLGRTVNKKMHDYKDFKYPFLKVNSLLSSSDITFGNLESPFFDKCPIAESGTFKFCGDYRSMEGILLTGFNVLSLENNHILNYGQEGRKQTISLLNQNKILPSTSELIIQQTNKLRFGFLSFDLTINNETERVLDAVKENVSQVDILIISLHWGVEYEKEPRSWQKDLAHKIIDSGAKLIIGHHPHVTQPTEKYKDGLIFYSLGNFVFDQMWSEETKKGKIAKIVFEDKEIKFYEEIPVYIIDYSQPQISK